MNALIKNHLFVLRLIFLSFCYLISVSASAATGAASKTNAPVFVFVDTLVTDHQTLVKDIQGHNLHKNITIVYLDPELNGVQQITDTLAKQTDVAAIHLLTHGMAGSIQLGNAALNQNTLDLYTKQLTAWRKSLSANADILIYGCSVTSTDAGIALLKQIGDLTQADVAAGKNLRGGASFGADWNLDSHYGKIETDVIISEQTQQSWDAILAYSTYINIGAGGVDQTFTATSNVGESFSYDSPGATYSVNRVVVSLKILAGADTSQNITLCLRSAWNGANLSSASMPTSRLTTSFAWYGFNVGATTLNDNQVYYIQIYTLSTDAKTVANIHNSSQWNSNTDLWVGVAAVAPKELSFMLSTGTNTTPAVNSAIPDQTGTPNVAFSYTVSSTAFTDADTGDYLTYSATLSSGAALPGWLSFNTTTRAFSGTPTTSGTISVKVTASDGTASTNDTFDIVVNTAPVVNSAIPDQAATEGSAFSFQFLSNAFTDADGDTLTYSATLSSNAALPAWLTFNAGTRTFSGTPLTANVGTISVKVTANDGITTITDTFDIVTASSLSYYRITHTTPGVTCAGSAITISAYNSSDALVAPANGTVITLSTSPATGSWVGGNTATFDGVVTSVTKYLQQTTASTLNINVTDGTHSEGASYDPSITFDAATLVFYGSTGLGAMVNEVAGTADNAPIIKAANCTAQVTGAKNVSFGYECRNPTTCVVGQTLSVNSNNIQSNSNGASITYSAAQSLTFDGSGIASIPLNYSDVGKVKIYATMTLAASGNNPAITLTANSGDIVFKPYTLAASAIQTSGAVANPGGSSTSGAASDFVPAGTAFTVKVEARNSAGSRTPNFGNETVTENNITFVPQALIYPAGGTLTALTNAAAFSATTPAGTFIDTTIYWNQVGSFTARPELADNDYLGAGDLVSKTTSGTIGRFYPDHFTLASSSTANSCVAGGFSYLSQPAISLNYVLQAKSSSNTTVTNYGSTYGVTQATVSYVAENANSGDGATFTSRLSDGATPSWTNGVMTVTSTAASVLRKLTTYAPDGPFTSLQWGLDLTETFDDGRSLTGKDMNALTTGACGGACTAVAIGSPLVLRYGRLRLDSASGPETANLPVTFLTEYWGGSHFATNANDSCTIVPLAAITYPSGTLATPANFTVTLGIGTTTGTYNNATGGIHFNAGTAGHYFSKPSLGDVGSFVVGINLTSMTWLRSDWNQDGTYSDASIPNVTYAFGTYRGRDRVLYWHERM